MSEDRRIYVVVAETVDTPSGMVIQPCGRVAAQCAHVVSQMRVESLVREWMVPGFSFFPITTIILAARDSKELEHVLSLLNKASIAVTVFRDTNPSVYGTEDEVTTAICTTAVKQIDMVGILDYLPLWSHSRDTRNTL